MIAAICLWLAAGGPVVLRDEPFHAAQPSEAVATITAGCVGCSWAEKNREAAVLTLSLDGRYSQHLMLARGAGSNDYRVALGAVGAGTHQLRIALDTRQTPAAVGAVSIDRIDVSTTPAGAADHDALALAPIIHARPNTLGGFTDLPLLLWYETDSTPRGTRIRYSVVFSNEDGGTPIDRLMATWGRATDIEFVYGVELDAGGRVLEEQIQGREHKLMPFLGRHEGRHPLLYVVTDNNMVSDSGTTSERYAPAPFHFELSGVSREAVMDAHPWTYAVASQEARREGRVAADARPGSRKIPDPRRFAYLEACADTRDTVLAFAVGVSGLGQELTWHESDAGLPGFRVERSATNFPNGCFRSSVALPPGTIASTVKALRFRAFARPPAKGEAPLPAGSGSARLRRVNKLFLLNDDDTPAATLFSWSGDAALQPDGPPIELPLR